MSRPAIVPGAGTPEQRWEQWPGLAALPVLPLHAARRVVVVAPHPDDETLAVGGTVALLREAGAPVLLVAATDGEASHPGSRVATPEQLGARRVQETGDALAALGDGVEHLRLALPDGGLAAHEAALADALVPLLDTGTWCLATWEGDAHPDHEAAGRAARTACAATGARLLRYPLWAWHWAAPGDPRVPWEQAVRVPLTAAARTRKEAALRCYPSQTSPLGPAPEDAAVVPPAVVAHFQRPFEVLLA